MTSTCTGPATFGDPAVWVSHTMEVVPKVGGPLQWTSTLPLPSPVQSHLKRTFREMGGIGLTERERCTRRQPWYSPNRALPYAAILGSGGI